MTKLNQSTQLTRLILNKRGLLIGSILLIAMVSFEAFNFTTTQVALNDLLGNLSFGGITWATILAIAFCGIDFAGIAHLFLPEDQIRASDKDTWYLFGAWLLAASMNAMLTWWGVSIAILNRTLHSNAFIKTDVVVEIIPIFVALGVWLTRILLIGAFSTAGPRLFTTVSKPVVLSSVISTQNERYPQNPHPESRAPHPRPVIRSPRPVNSHRPNHVEPEYVPDPSYIPVQNAVHSLAGRSTGNGSQNSKTAF